MVRDRWAVLIVGAGPAGSSTALYLAQLDPGLARHVLLLDKAVHPRPKVCAGGLIPATWSHLGQLGLTCPVPLTQVERAVVRTPSRKVVHGPEPLCTVVRRNEFDHWLVRTCIERGIEHRGGEKVVQLVRERDGVMVRTTRTTHHAAVVVGADGAGSLVRRTFFPLESTAGMGRAVMVDVPLREVRWRGWPDHFEFDFRDVPDGLRGYGWIFPCWIDGEPHLNVGVYSSRSVGSGESVRASLQRLLDRIGAPAPVRWQAAPIRWYRGRPRLGAERVLLVGDAAGVDGLMGEGISYAFEYGAWAAGAIVQGLQKETFDLQEAEEEFHRSWVGKKLRRLALLEGLFYGPTHRWWFLVGERSAAAREIGLRWYNGIDGWDRASGWQAVRAWWNFPRTPNKGLLRGALKGENAGGTGAWHNS